MFEYAISSGEGTLIEYGVCTRFQAGDMAMDISGDETIIIAPCPDDCETGK